MSNTIDFTDFSNGSIVNNTWTGTGVFDQLMIAINGNIKVQFDSGRLTGSEYSDVYLGAMNAALAEAMKYTLNKKSVEKALESQDIQIAIQEVQLAENSEKWALQKAVLQNQLTMSNVDVNYKEQNVLRDLEIRDKQIESAAADISFNESKKNIMEQTRKDNIRAKATEQFAEFMKYISAANVIPGATDFTNMRNLITAMNTGIANPDAIATITDTTSNYTTVA